MDTVKEKKELTRNPEVSTTEGAPSILFNRDHFLGVISLFFYLALFLATLPILMTHTFRIWSAILTFICDSSLSAHWAFTVVWDVQGGAKKRMLH